MQAAVFEPTASIAFHLERRFAESIPSRAVGSPTRGHVGPSGRDPRPEGASALASWRGHIRRRRSAVLGEGLGAVAIGRIGVVHRSAWRFAAARARWLESPARRAR